MHKVIACADLALKLVSDLTNQHSHWTPILQGGESEGSQVYDRNLPAPEGTGILMTGKGVTLWD